jgi:secreted trypsin-like serine protease
MKLERALDQLAVSVSRRAVVQGGLGVSLLAALGGSTQARNRKGDNNKGHNRNRHDDHKRVDPEIFGGTAVPLELDIGIVGMLYGGSGDTWYKQQGCGGSLIQTSNGAYVLTAAHCVKNGGKVHRNIRVVVGAWDLIDETRGVAVPIEAGYIHRDYDGWDLVHDVAILKLAPEADLSRFRTMRPIRPEEGALEAPGSVLTVAGWGYMGGKGQSNFPSKLQWVKTEVISDRHCKDSYHRQDVQIKFFPGSHICTRSSFCVGDSGGPLFSDSSGELVQVGIVSWNTGACGNKKFPSVYTQLSNPANQTFIKGVLAGEVEPDA